MCKSLAYSYQTVQLVVGSSPTSATLLLDKFIQQFVFVQLQRQHNGWKYELIIYSLLVREDRQDLILTSKTIAYAEIILNTVLSRSGERNI